MNDELIDMDRDSKVLFVFLEEKLKTLIYILVFFGNSQIKIKIVRISNHTLKVLSWLKKILGKIEENYSSKVREIVSYNDSKPVKFFLKLFQNLTYFSAFCVIILVEYFVLLMLHKCCWILINYSFNLKSLTPQFICYC